MEVDVARKRVSFTMRLNDSAPQASSPKEQGKPSGKRDTQAKKSAQHQQNRQQTQAPANPLMGNAFADAFAKAKKK